MRTSVAHLTPCLRRTPMPRKKVRSKYGNIRYSRVVIQYMVSRPSLAVFCEYASDSTLLVSDLRVPDWPLRILAVLRNPRPRDPSEEKPSLAPLTRLSVFCESAYSLSTVDPGVCSHVQITHSHFINPNTRPIRCLLSYFSPRLLGSISIPVSIIISISSFPPLRGAL